MTKPDLSSFEGYTEGPWEYGHGLPGVFVPHQINEDGDVDFDVIAPQVSTEQNARLIAAAPDILAYARELEAKNKELIETLKEMRDSLEYSIYGRKYDSKLAELIKEEL